MEPYQRTMSSSSSSSKKGPPSDTSPRSTCFVKKLFTMVAVEDSDILSFTAGKKQEPKSCFRMQLPHP